MSQKSQVIKVELVIHVALELKNAQCGGGAQLSLSSVTPSIENSISNFTFCTTVQSEMCVGGIAA